MHEDEKYIVFKREEWAALRKKLSQVDIPSVVDRVLGLTPLDDAVVIRTQDVFATSGLRAYRDTILTHRNLLMTQRGWPMNVDLLDVIDQLDRSIAYFTEVTIEAEDRFNRGDVKVPD